MAQVCLEEEEEEQRPHPDSGGGGGGIGGGGGKIKMETKADQWKSTSESVLTSRNKRKVTTFLSDDKNKDTCIH